MIKEEMEKNHLFPYFSVMIWTILTLLILIIIATSSVYPFTTLLPQQAYADIVAFYRNECLYGDPNRVITQLSFAGIEPGDIHNMPFYSYDIINPSGRLQGEPNVVSGIAGTQFSLDPAWALHRENNPFGIPVEWTGANLPITFAQEGPGTYTVRIFHISADGHATLIRTISIDLPFPCAVRPGTLTVYTQVRGGPGVPPVPADLSGFSSQVVGNSPAPSEPFTALPGGNSVALQPGFFRVDQITHVPDYTISFSGDCDSTGRGSITSGANLRCIVTNTYTSPAGGTGTLRVFKEVINHNGGGGRPGDFTMRITGETGIGGTFTPPNNIFAGIDETHGGTTIILHPGHYAVSEEQSHVIEGLPARYTVRYSPECTGDMQAGETKTCTVTNDGIRQPGVRVISATTLTITKTVIPAAQTALRYSVHIDGTSNNIHGPMDIGVGLTQSQTVTIQTGTYRVIEHPVPVGYAAIYSDGCNGTLTGEPVSERTCAITNVAITQNMSSSGGIRGLSIAPAAQQCLQNPSCVDPLGIPSSLIQCLQNPDCFRTLNIDTNTGMSIQHKFIKKEIISGEEGKKNTNETGKLINQSSANAFNQTSNVTSIKGIAIKK